ncbi:metal ABC transporter solute-binding protein, Zn/Mn family [Streptomyces sp. AC495_CC817]|uniref:metal ABC transporter solute-binding protein, Zn/Mn family n=1 Tax=Streptomyces sp. AC495_CC817 TaxID=2823900 RepID=UPI001C27EB49|nr:zinc ABC transporter substrate-binding protein [Streptomyces sp. AC495_CC817]
MHKPLASVALAATAVLMLAGCSSSPAAESTGDAITVVASTNVYGSLAAEIGGDRVQVTSIIDNASQDPHSYEASARDRLAVQKADLVIENGGGYDSFIDTLLEGAKDPAVVTAVEYSHDFPGNEGHEADADAEGEAHDHAEDEHAEEDHAHDHGDGEGHDHIEGFNEHVWFDAHTMIHVVEAIAAELAEIDPDGKTDFEASAAEITGELEGFEADLETLKSEAAGAKVFITEPLPGYLAEAAGLTDATPEGFAESVEEGTDVAPATLLAALDVIGSGDVRAVLSNAQTGGAETQRVEDAAKAAGIPVVAFTELLEDGSSYAEWMRDGIKSLADAVTS